jgi:ribonucleoside-diphosphate reductase beta chain
LTNSKFKTGTEKNDQKLLEAVIVFANIFEGIFFSAGFAQVLALGRRNLMPGICEMWQYIKRDEDSHAAVGQQIAKAIIKENPHLWTNEFKERMIDNFKKAVELESAYAIDSIPDGIMGITHTDYIEYIKFIASRRLKQMGLTDIYKNTKNPFPWLSEAIELKKEKNFFESRVTEYQTGSLEW